LVQFRPLTGRSTVDSLIGPPLDGGNPRRNEDTVQHPQGTNRGTTLRRFAGVAGTLLACAVLMPVAGAYAQPGDTTVLEDNFESGTFANWTRTVSGNGLAEVQAGIGTNGSKGARLTVPDYSTNSMAYIKHTLATPSYGLSASGKFKVNSGGCSDEAGYSAGSVPFLRFFDADGRRIAGLVRINGSCSKTAKLYVQHSGNYYRTGKNVSFGAVNTFELRIAVGAPSKSLVQVFMNGSKVYESTIADNGLKPVASVNIHNEHPDQVGDLIADDIKIASFQVTAPTNPCDAAFPLPTSTDPGTTILSDNFEAFDFARWTNVTRDGDATATIQTANVHSGRCAAQLNVTKNTSSKANLSKTTPAGTGSIWADGWFDFLAEGTTTNSNVPMFRVFSGTSRIADIYRANGTGQMYLRLTSTSGTTTYHSLGRIAALNRWYHVKLHVDASGSASTVRILIDGTQVFSTTTAALGTSAISSVMVGSEHFAQEGVFAADDVVINASA
jgi:hypothetical protein